MPNSTSSSSTRLDVAQHVFSFDENRIRGRRAVLLELLLDGEWHPNYECRKPGGISFNCSLYALRIPNTPS